MILSSPRNIYYWSGLSGGAQGHEDICATRLMFDPKFHCNMKAGAPTHPQSRSTIYSARIIYMRFVQLFSAHCGLARVKRWRAWAPSHWSAVGANPVMAINRVEAVSSESRDRSLFKTGQWKEILPSLLIFILLALHLIPAPMDDHRYHLSLSYITHPWTCRRTLSSLNITRICFWMPRPGYSSAKKKSLARVHVGTQLFWVSNTGSMVISISATKQHAAH